MEKYRFIYCEGINCENTPLHYVSEKGNLEGVRFLVNDMGANVHASCDCPHHKTALHYATERNHYDIVEFLIKSKADPNALDSRNYTALDLCKNDKIKRLLIANGGTTGKDVHVFPGQRLNLPKANCQHSIKA